jgi:monofunctional biosynthetic peptidoglycan transglycosylase
MPGPPPGDVNPLPRRSRDPRRRILAAAGIALLLAAALALPALLEGFRHPVAGLAARAPRRTALMLAREAEARRAGRTPRTRQSWVPYDRISPTLRRAVLIAEDDAFFSHGGLDWNEIGASARANWRARRIVRGGSTITQQLARNLFLGERRTLDRKLAEVVLAWRLERTLSKRRIFELYLNLIEWGDGVYGAEAAARSWYGVPAAQLGPREAAALAAVIINPRRYSPVAPSRRIEKRIRTIVNRMARRGFLTPDESDAALGRAPLPAAADTTAPPTDTTGLDGTGVDPGPAEPPDGRVADSLSLPAPP